jgi:hypothetical protein
MEVKRLESQNQPDLELKGLSNFYGSEHYYRLMGGINATDGVHYVMNNGYSYLVTDAIAVLRAHPKLKQYLLHDDFVVIKLQRLPSNQALMLMEDGNGHELYRQAYVYSDAKVDLKLFYTNGVLLLASEY